MRFLAFPCLSRFVFLDLFRYFHLFVIRSFEIYLKNHRNSVLVTLFGCLNSLKYAQLLNVEYSALWFSVQMFCLILDTVCSEKLFHEETSSKCYDWSESYGTLLERKDTSFITDEDYVDTSFIYGLQDILEWIWSCITGL